MHPQPHIRLSALLTSVLLGACAAEVGGPTAGDPAPEESLLEKGDGDRFCTLEAGSIQIGFGLSSLTVDANPCHEGSTRIEVGERLDGMSLTHDTYESDGDLGCIGLGDGSVPSVVHTEAHAYRIPVTSNDPMHIRAAVDGEGGVTLDLLVARPVRIFGVDGMQQVFEPVGNHVAIDEPGADTSRLHEKDGEMFIVVRVRPDAICANRDQVAYGLSVSAE